MRIGLAILVELLLTSTVLCQELKLVTYGKYAVGFSSSLEFDYSRPAKNKNQYGRAVQVNIWYPAEASAATPMNFRDYLQLISAEDSTSDKKQSDEQQLRTLLELAPTGELDMQPWRTFLARLKPMKGIKNARIKNQDFPVVQLIHGSAANYCVLGEYLASHGMIVVNVPYKGYLQNTFDVNVMGMETEIRDQEFAFETMVRKFKVKATKVALVGTSFGGQSAVGLAVRNPLVKCIVSLDGGIGSTFGPQLLSGFPFYNVEKVNMPILHLYNPADPGGNIDWFGVAEYNDRLLVGFKNMDHAFFGIKGLLENEMPYILGREKPRPGDNYEAILLYTFTFTNGVFGSEPDLKSTIELDQHAAWISPTLLSKEFRRKKFEPLPIAYLQGVVRNKGVDELLEVHRRQKEITSMPISDGSYRTLFLEAFASQKKPHMLKLSEYYEIDFPQSAFAKYYRGRALLSNGQVPEAKKYFQQCLELIPGDKFMSAVEKETIRQRAEGLLEN